LIVEAARDEALKFLQMEGKPLLQQVTTRASRTLDVIAGVALGVGFVTIFRRR
jgi:hypothetical protein